MTIRNYLSESTIYSAYWITPTGKVLDCNVKTHINYVCDAPRKFGITEKELAATYAKYGETVGVEGKAREEILLTVIRSGFIRIRKYKNMWSINVANYNRRAGKLLSNWAYDIIQNPKEDKYLPVNITADTGNPPKNITIEDLSGIVESHKPLQLITLNEMEYLVETEFQQYLNELYKQEPESYERRIDEASISRIVSKIKDPTVEFVIITAFRSGNTLSVNQNKTHQLLKDFRNILENEKSYGAYRLIGHWKECSVEIPSGKNISDCSSLGGHVVDSIEESWLILNDAITSSEDFFMAAQTMAGKYNQDAFIARTNNKKFGLYGKDGSEWATFGNISDTSFTTGLTTLIGRQGYSEIKKVRGAGRLFNIVMESIEFGVHVPYYSGSQYRAFNYNNILYFCC